jgi:hypothetical protein
MILAPIRAGLILRQAGRIPFQKQLRIVLLGTIQARILVGQIQHRAGRILSNNQALGT